ncbi:MAG: gamma-glutamyltransferase [Anaeromyxobacteraceae bacterium]
MSQVLALLLAASAISPRGAAATASPLASQVAADVLAAGGNAVDAAVAAAYVLAVVANTSSGLGGGGYALVYVAKEGRVHAVDFREVAPAAATPTMFAGAPREPGRPRPSLDGGLAVAVPSAARGYAWLARTFGTWKPPALVEPAARIAERGYAVGTKHALYAKERLECLRARPAAAAEYLVKGPDGAWVPPQIGDRVVRKDLARTLRALGKDPDALNRGPLARRIVAAARADGGILTEADLAAVTVRERTPIEGRYRGHRVVSMPLPSSGGAIVIALLQALEAEDPKAGGYRGDRWLHAMAELEKRLFARRATLGDPDFVPGAEAAVRELVSPAFAARLHAEVGERASDPPAGGGPEEGEHTNHIAVADRDGNVVSLTTTVNVPFGSCVVVPGTGVLLNDQMDDFDAAPGVPNYFGVVGTGANLPAPGKRPLSSMAPTLVFDGEGRPILSVGAAGGSTIPTTLVQAISNVIDLGMPLEQALGAPRIHHQWRPPTLRVEPFGLEAATIRALEARGHVLDLRKAPWGEAAAVGRLGTMWEAASDPRWEGRPAAP